jgi:DNA invertase Pin-like site-specific DNA recombinase
MHHEVHIGQLIEAKMKADGRSAQWLARQLSCAVSNIYKIYEKPSIDSDLLWRLTQLLQEDFFAYYSNAFKKK